MGPTLTPLAAPCRIVPCRWTLAGWSDGMQTDAYARLSKLEAQWYDLTRKNAEIELACAYLEVELAPLKARAAAAATAEAAARRAEAEAEVGPMATDS